MKILITGSEGRIGRILSEGLKDHELVFIDKEEPVNLDLLSDKILPCFNNVETVVHLAGHSEPWCSEKQGRENFRMTQKVYEAAAKKGVKRVIFSSSINVYDYRRLFRNVDMIRKDTELNPSVWRDKKFYGESKILCERLGENYHKDFGIDVLNLRLGVVMNNDKPPSQNPVDYAIWLSKRDLTEIVRSGLSFEGCKNLTCTSKNSNFIDLDPIKEVLGYVPQDSSIDR